MKPLITFKAGIHVIVVLLIVFLLLWQIEDASAEEPYAYAEFSQGFAFSSNWIGNYPTSVQAGVHFPVAKRQYLRMELQHISNIGQGCNLQIGDRCKWAVDNREETWLNQVTITYGMRFSL